MWASVTGRMVADEWGEKVMDGSEESDGRMFGVWGAGCGIGGGGGGASVASRGRCGCDGGTAYFGGCCCCCCCLLKKERIEAWPARVILSCESELETAREAG